MTNYKNQDSSFIQYLAPTLCGIKPANLFTISVENCPPKLLEKWNRNFLNQNLQLKAIRISETRIMIFSYDIVWIRKILSDVVIQAYLLNKGYSNPLDTTKTLEELFKRLSYQKGFPHEVGFFLGYPFEDVISFEQNQGRNCKYCGLWKSYCNPEEAKKCCAQYKQCSQMCKKWFEEGLTVPQIIEKHKQAVQHAA